MTNQKNKGDHISFNLDGRWFGQGNICRVIHPRDQYEVELTVQCKEFTPGTKIIVDHGEIISFLPDWG